MDKIYNHTNFESKIYQLWEGSGSFSPGVDAKKKPFCIIMPPPNANENLHIGHARFVAVEDILTRYHRMLGDATLWLPGADHAGIETQFVFEKKLNENGKSRFDYSPQQLYKMIWDYVQGNKSTMENQLRILGASCDWKREKFTLDPEIVKIVYQTFKSLYQAGMIYRGERIVNYCTRCGTAYSQLEVNYQEQEDTLYYLDYKTVQIATTRPETIFADMAVAINPKDPKYAKLASISAFIPLINREIPIIKDFLVDPSFGTGALKVTPAHDPVDFEIGTKHGLSIISTIDQNGRMINTPERFIGLGVKAAREAVVADLKASGKIVKEEPIKHLIGRCYRCKTPIEPSLSKQWFLKTQGLAKKSLSAIKNKEVVFASEKFKKIAVHWLKNLRDWNISRQIVWGIQIPAWRCTRCLEWIVTDGEEPKECSCGSSKFARDNDTFDTWFSSGQWPYATLQTGKKGDFEYFYPTSVMETAYDIIPFWVIRMIMLGLYSTNKVPFRHVLIHGLVRDREGQKISKSKGNVIDPASMVEKYGADALRMGLVWGALVENDICLSEDNIRGQRNFSNKIWNIARFVLQGKTGTPQGKRVKLAQIDKEILKKLKSTIKRSTKAIDGYRLNEAAEILYDFIWHEYADIYIEACKSRISSGGEDSRAAQATLIQILDTCLRLLHPFMPFVTEAIWQEGFAKDKNDLLINAPWPK